MRSAAARRPSSAPRWEGPRNGPRNRPQSLSFESKYGTAPEAKTVNKGEIVELPNLGTDGDYTFVGWIMKGS